MRYIILTLFACCFCVGNITAQTDSLKIGDKAPLFSIVDHSGDTISLQEKLKSGKVVLVFYRGAWCPYCNKHMSHLQDSLNLILAKGASLIAITPEINQSIDKTVSKTKATFNIVYDSTYTIMRQYGTAFKVDAATIKRYKLIGLDVEEANGNKDHILPVPATFIIGKDGIILWKHFDTNYKKRSTVKEIVEHL
ncbi:MAG: peroxiredoxin-like family protein [Bacteroidia bacterium]